MSSGQASGVVSAVYESGNSAAGNTAQIIMFIGGHLANADPAASITSFTQQFPGAKVVTAGALGGKAACVQDGTGSNSVSMCAWFDNDSFGEIVSPTMNATALARAMRDRPPVRGGLARSSRPARPPQAGAPVIRRYSQNMSRLCRAPVSAWRRRWPRSRSRASASRSRRQPRAGRRHLRWLPVSVAPVPAGCAVSRPAAGQRAAAAARRLAAPCWPLNHGAGLMAWMASPSTVTRLGGHGGYRPRGAYPDQERLVDGRLRVQRAQVRVPGPDQLARTARAVRPAPSPSAVRPGPRSACGPRRRPTSSSPRRARARARPPPAVAGSGPARSPCRPDRRSRR